MPTKGTADSDRDSDEDGDDYTVRRANFSQRQAADPDANEHAAILEPATLVMRSSGMAGSA